MVSICTRILKYWVWKIKFDELDFFSISNLNFAGYTGSKNLIQTRQKFQFIKLDFSNSIFQNPSTDRYHDWLVKYIPPIYLNWVFFPVWNQLDIFASFMARVKYFDGPCLTINSLSTIYRDIHYQFPVWWIHYSHCYESKR